MTKTLELKIEALKTEYKTGEPVRIRIFLFNRDDDPIFINSRFGINREGHQGEVFFNLKNETNQLAFTARVNIGAPNQEDLTLVLTDNFVGREIIVNDYFDLIETGKYKMKAIYSNSTKKEGNTEYVSWTGQLTSNEIPVIITN